MPITVKSIYRDTGFFFRNQHTALLLIAFFCAFITTLLNYIFLPNREQIVESVSGNGVLMDSANFFESVQNMTEKQKRILFRASVIAISSNLISNTILTGSVLSLVQLILTYHNTSALQAIIASMQLLPKLFILIFQITFLTEIGTVFFIIPGIMLIIVLALSPIIFVKDNVNITSAMRNSVHITWKNMHLVAPAVTNWILTRILLVLFISNFSKKTLSLGAMILPNFLSNLSSEILLIYLFRLYMLVY